MIKTVFVAVLFCMCAACHAQNRNISFKDPGLFYQGRIIYRNDAAVLSWPGTSVTVRIQGGSISAVMKDLDTANYYNVIVDNQVVRKIHTDTVKRTYVLATGLSSGLHEVQLFKRTEWDKGKTLFYGFEMTGKVLPAPVPQKRKMEFYGNSITCGYAIEDNSGGDSWFGCFENNYLTYAAITARHFNAQYYCNSKSGIGIMLSWFPLIMPEIYDRADPTDSTSKWDFSKYTPDVVLINLFQNDSWLVKRHDFPEFKHRFGTKEPDTVFIIDSYRRFVKSIRDKYPQAHIICALGSMDATRTGSPWPGYIRQAVSQINDPKIYTHFFPFKNAYGHPNVDEQKAMADSLIEFIEKTIRW